MFYTYAHYKPEGGLFYVGKGKENRAYCLSGRGSHWNNVVNKYGKPYVEILAKWETEQEAISHEILLIASLRDIGILLVNKTDGGDGLSGYKHTEETIKKMRQTSLNQSAETKQKISDTLKGHAAWNKGISPTYASKEKMRKAKLGKVCSKEHRENISKAKRNISEETRQRLSESAKKYWKQKQMKELTNV